MIVLCSCYDIESWRGVVYSTCVQPYEHKRVAGNLDFLAPTDKIVYGHKHWSGISRFSKWPKVSTDEYTSVYRQLLARRWKSEVKPWLDRLDPAVDLTLLCYCQQGKFCHRQLLAQMLAKHRPDIRVVLR